MILFLYSNHDDLIRKIDVVKKGDFVNKSYFIARLYCLFYMTLLMQLRFLGKFSNPNRRTKIRTRYNMLFLSFLFLATKQLLTDDKKYS